MSFKSIIGQDHACQVLTSALVRGHVPHAYIFTGANGVGKRTTAKEWAKAIQCLQPPSAGESCGLCASCEKIDKDIHPDVLHINYDFQATLKVEDTEKQINLKIDTMRAMERLLSFKPYEGRAKIAIVDPADQLTEDAAHSLLKILEDPPPAVHIVLLSVDSHGILPTIRSRCQTVAFRTLPTAMIEKFLTEKHGFPPDAAKEMAEFAEGSLELALAAAEGSDGAVMDYENATVNDILEWCAQLQRPKRSRDDDQEPSSKGRRGRIETEKFLKRLLLQHQNRLYSGELSAQQTLQQIMDAMRKVRQNVSPQLTLEVLLLSLRRHAGAMNHPSY
ncbi:MAG TPA: DNA polymerase III subunit [Elusimicrobiota bacterium]|nr:DNA polymerase III subunit [Elusimicrobiota bacterium]